jgi:CheY-like chemotaxis protein
VPAGVVSSPSPGARSFSADRFGMTPDKLNILLVDDHPAKLLTYEAILQDLGENLINADSARSAFEHLLKQDIAVALLDVCMPELDGFQLARMIREHPRCKKTAIIFISGIYLTDDDRLRGYELGAVDYVQVPVIPEVLRSKVKIFMDLHRTTWQLEQLNRELEDRVVARTKELAASNARLIQSEQLRELALAAEHMGTWELDIVKGQGNFDKGQCRIFGVDPKNFEVTAEYVRALIHPEDRERLTIAWAEAPIDFASAPGE